MTAGELLEMNLVWVVSIRDLFAATMDAHPSAPDNTERKEESEHGRTSYRNQAAKGLRG